MAWLATESFDSYTSGTGLATQNGGSGWAGAWTNVTGTAWAVSNAQSFNGSNAAVITGYTSGTEPEVKRVLGTASNTDGDKLTFAMYRSASNDNLTMYGYDATTYRISISLEGNGNITCINNGAFTILGTWTANTWYRFDIVLTYSTKTYTVSINQGATSAAQTFHSNAGVDLTELHLGVGSNASVFTGYVDAIQPTPAAVTAVFTKNIFPRQAVNRASTY